MTIDPQQVLARIDVDELVKVALDLGNIDSPTGREGPVADYVHDWLERAGFAPRAPLPLTAIDLCSRERHAP